MSSEAAFKIHEDRITNLESNLSDLKAGVAKIETTLDLKTSYISIQLEKTTSQILNALNTIQEITNQHSIALSKLQENKESFKETKKTIGKFAEKGLKILIPLLYTGILSWLGWLHVHMAALEHLVK